MARTPREHRLETREMRLKLKARTEPYWRQIVPGTFVATGAEAGQRWVARQQTAGELRGTAHRHP